MSEIDDGADSLSENITAMGEMLGRVFTALSNELLMTHWQWQEYLDLGSTEGRVEALNASAPFFFWLVQRALFLDTLLRISKLTGPPTSGRWGQANLTVQQLPVMVADAALRDRLSSRCKNVAEQAKFAKAWRDKLIAHHDLKLALRTAKILPPAERAQIDAVLAELANLLNEMRDFYAIARLFYPRLQSSGGASELLYYVRDGLRCEQRRTELLERGEYDPTWWHAELPPL